MGAYEETYRRWQADPEGFWAELAAAHRVGPRRPRSVLDASDAPLYRWFPGGRLNTCVNAARPARARRPRRPDSR